MIFVVLCSSVCGVVITYIVASCGCVGYLVALLCWVCSRLCIFSILIVLLFANNYFLLVLFVICGCCVAFGLVCWFVGWYVGLLLWFHVCGVGHYATCWVIFAVALGYCRFVYLLYLWVCIVGMDLGFRLDV